MTIAALGGSVGSLLGMYTFRHKTCHPKFTVGIPVIFVLQIGLWVVGISSCGKFSRPLRKSRNGRCFHNVSSKASALRIPSTAADMMPPA